MPTQSTFTSPVDGLTIATYSWGEELSDPRGVVQISHGLAEHGARYDRFARALVDAEYRVQANDHRGHGHTAPTAADLGHFGEAGFPGLISDVAALGDDLAQRNPGLPLFLFGHSMGSFAAQGVILDHSALYRGVVLSGSSVLDVLAAFLADAPADPEEGGGGLDAFNGAFEHRTGYEWLSRDEAEVDAYVADPLCGFDLPADAFPQLLGVAPQLADNEALARIRKDLPILIASGQDDPLAGGGDLIAMLAQRYRDTGLTDVADHVFEGARHEILNETNRDEVTALIIDWIDGRV